MESASTEATTKSRKGAKRTLVWVAAIALVLFYGPIRLIYCAKTPFQYIFDDRLPVQLAIRQGFLGPYAMVQFDKDINSGVSVIAFNHLGRQSLGYYRENGVRAGTQLNIGGGEGWSWKVGQELVVCSKGYRPVVWTCNGSQWTRRVVYGVEEADYCDRIETYEKKTLR